jgi:hypothetical protein
LSWPWGLTYDPQRSRVLLSSFGGEGYLYGYAPGTEQWSLVRSMENRDVDSLEYHAANDSLYGLTVFGGECGSPSVMKFTPSGEFQTQFPLDLQAYGLSLGTDHDRTGFCGRISRAPPRTLSPGQLRAKRVAYVSN